MAGGVRLRTPTIDLDDDSLNPHFAYDDEDAHVRHQVWFLDAVTVLNEMRAARALGIQTFALWRLGSEDNSLWKIWDNPLTSDPVKDLAHGRARLRRRYRGRRRHSPRHPQAAERPAHRHHGRRRPRSPRSIARSPTRRWTPIRSPTRCSSTAITPTRSRSPSTTAPTPSGRRRFSTS